MVRFERRGALLASIAGAAAIYGAGAAWHYHRLGLTLTHYDARGHLVVARRIFDSITPGWQQVGAVWLPLPHLLNAIPVQIDVLYRTGASAVAISIAAFAVAVAAIAAIVLMLTQSAAAAAAVFALNPNVVYLQSTPMTEPLLLALTLGAVALLIRWVAERAPSARSTQLVGVVFALACLTRYEAWPVTALALAAAAWTLWRRGEAPRRACGRVAGIAFYPAIAIVGFTVFSRVVIGEWFVGSGFFVPENKALGLPGVAAKEILWGLRTLSTPEITTVAAVGAIGLFLLGFVFSRRGDALIAL